MITDARDRRQKLARHTVKYSKPKSPPLNSKIKRGPNKGVTRVGAGVPKPSQALRHTPKLHETRPIVKHRGFLSFEPTGLLSAAYHSVHDPISAARHPGRTARHIVTRIRHPGRGPQTMMFPGGKGFAGGGEVPLVHQLEHGLGRMSRAEHQQLLARYVAKGKTPIGRANRYVQQVFPKEYKGLKRSVGHGMKHYRQPKKWHMSGEPFELDYTHPSTGAHIGMQVRHGEHAVTYVPQLAASNRIGYGELANTDPSILMPLMKRALAPGQPIRASVVNDALRRFMRVASRRAPGYLEQWMQENGLTGRVPRASEVRPRHYGREHSQRVVRQQRRQREEEQVTQSYPGGISYVSRRIGDLADIPDSHWTTEHTIEWNTLNQVYERVMNRPHPNFADFIPLPPL